MADNAAQIAAFLASKGLPKAAIAALIGNFQQESGLNPGNVNPRESAIGLAQWEGGRRTALQHYAAQHNLNEGDLQAQLGYLWQELTGPYAGVLQQLRNATDPAQAAALVDQSFEVSDGSARQARINYATSYYNSGKLNNVTGADYVPNTATGAATVNPTRADYQEALSQLAGALNSVPELKHLVDEAIRTGQPKADFQNAVFNTKWYKTHADSARQQIALAASDPATYKQNLNQALAHVHQIAAMQGAQLKPGQDVQIAHRLLFENLPDNQLQKIIAQTPNLTGLKSTSGLTGQIAQYAQQLQQMAADYGVTWGPSQYAYRAQQIVAGAATQEQYKQMMINAAKARYPSLAPQLDSGLTLKDISDPYRQTMSQLLELNPNSITLNDPLISKALQGVGAPGGKPGTSSQMPMWQFQDTLRQDPRWAYTDNANQAVSQALVGIGRDWGFGF